MADGDRTRPARTPRERLGAGARARVEAARPRRDLRRGPHQPGPVHAALQRRSSWGFLGSLLGTIAGVAIFRGLIDVIAHRFIPAPTLYGAEAELKDEDIVSRRRRLVLAQEVPPASGGLFVVGVLLIASR